MIQGAAEAGAAAAALQLLKVAIFMAALTEARLTVVAVDSAPEVALGVEVIMLAGPQDIGAGAVEVLIGALRRDTMSGTIPFPCLWRLYAFLRLLILALRNDFMMTRPRLIH